MISPPEQPVYFGPADRRLFGWLHAGGSGLRSGLGIVFCNPVGYESISGHRTVRAAAQRAAAQGCATLRFDYDGTGDSAGEDTDAGRLDAWISSINTAIDQLRSVAGVTRIALWGLRFGATLAVLVINRRRDVHALYAVAPIVSGRKYLRELRTLAFTGAGVRDTDELQEVAGFITTPETRAAIAAVDLNNMELPTATRVRVANRDDLPCDERWIVAAQQRACDASATQFRGFAAMMLDPHEVQVPEAMLEASLAWLLRDDTERLGAATVVTRSNATPLASTANIRHTDFDRCEEIVESAVLLGADPAIFAIVTRKASTETHAAVAPSPLVVLLNSGSVPHFGPNRVYVTLARLLASRGLTVARIDLPGLGDSAPHAGARENMPYSPTALADIRSALLELQRRYDAKELHLCGICSGAYHALKCALDAPTLRSALVINPLTFFWQQGMTVRMPEARVTAEAARYGRTVLQWAAWKKLLSGRVKVVTAARIAAHRIAQLSRNQWREFARRMHMPMADDLGAELRDIARRQVQLRFIFSESDPGLTMLHEQGGYVVRELLRARALEIDVIPDTDHTFTNLAGRNAMIAKVLSHFDTRVRPASQ